MKQAIQTQHQLQAPIEKIWDQIKTGANWEAWFPLLTGSRIENHVRYCELSDGKVMEERFLASDAEKTFIYAIDQQESFPATDIVGYIRLEPQGEATMLYWTVEMEVDDMETLAMLEQQIAPLYAASAQQLATLSTANA